MRRVLIITYYWPPNGGAGVQRWLKMAKYLPAQGWQPVVYTPSDPEVITADPDLEREVPSVVEVVKRPITEPYTFYKRLTGRKANEKMNLGFLNEGKKAGWREGLAVWLRGNLFIPDARVWWVRPSVRFLLDYLKKHPVDAIVSTGPPHSMHLIALALKKRLGVRWVADWRDPWTNIDFYDQLKLTGWADRKHHRLERSVLAHADVTVTVGWTWAEELRALGGRNVEVITNGYDPADVPVPPAPVDDVFSLVHVGSMNAARNIPELWRLLAHMCAADPAFAQRLRIRFVGAVDQAALRDIADAGLMGNVERLGTVGHAQAMKEMQKARVLLLSVNDAPNAKGVLTSKLYEYLAVGRPILAVGPKDGDVARVVRPPHALIERGELADAAGTVRALFEIGGNVVSSSAGMHARPELAVRMAALLAG